MCIFCKIAAGEIPTHFLYESEKVVAFKDLNPEAPSHVLVIPREHFENAAELAAADSATLTISDSIRVIPDSFESSTFMIALLRG